MIYQILVITAIVVIFVLLRGIPIKELFKKMVTRALFLGELTKGKQVQDRSNLFHKARIISFNLTILFFLLLLITSFPVIILGYKLSGILLILHVTFAPFFVVFFALMVVLWAHQMQFTLQSDDTTKLKTLFWLALVSSILAIFSIILTMYPLFGTDGQFMLIEIHKYSTLILFIILSVFILTKYADENIVEGK